MESNPIKLLRMLKGAPISIYMAIIYAKTTVTSNWLEIVTGYSDKPITKGLRLLEEYELIIKNKGGWKIRSGFQYKLKMPMKEDEKIKHEALEKYGVREPKLSDLALCDELKVDFIKAHIKKAIIQGISTGLLIHRIIARDEMPEFKENGHLKGCTCNECSQYKYIEGEYGDVGNH